MHEAPWGREGPLNIVARFLLISKSVPQRWVCCITNRSPTWGTQWRSWGPFSPISGSCPGCWAKVPILSVPDLCTQVENQQAARQGILCYAAQLLFKTEPWPPPAVRSGGCWKLTAEPSSGAALVPGYALALGAACIQWPVNAGGIIPLSQVRLLWRTTQALEHFMGSVGQISVCLRDREGEELDNPSGKLCCNKKKRCGWLASRETRVQEEDFLGWKK